jgi:DNA-binding transcriptional regulator YiaG
MQLIEKFLSDRVQQMAEEEMEKARERLKLRVPELASELGIRLNQYMNPMQVETVMQILLRVKI